LRGRGDSQGSPDKQNDQETQANPPQGERPFPERWINKTASGLVGPPVGRRATGTLGASCHRA
jgi:hypothetical protein